MIPRRVLRRLAARIDAKERRSAGRTRREREFDLNERRIEASERVGYILATLHRGAR